MMIVPLSTQPHDAVEALLDRAFGADRHQRTAYRVRQGTTAIDALSFAGVENDGRLIGTIQCWPVAHVGDDGTTTPLVMVGPVAVEPAEQRAGAGRALMRAALDAAGTSDRVGFDKLMLVGDPEYYARFFGFDADRTGHWRLPGPFDARRLLSRGAVPDRPGMLAPRVYAAAEHA